MQNLEDMRRAIVMDESLQRSALLELESREELQEADVKSLRIKHLRAMCDIILLRYLDQQRLDRFANLRDLPVAELLEKVHFQIVLVLECIDALQQRTDLADDHLLAIASETVVAQTLCERYVLSEEHPEVLSDSIQNILPMPTLENMIKAVGRQLRILQQDM